MKMKIIACFLLCMPFALCAKQHAMVVGINQYQYAGQLGLENLAGAVNDAQLLAKVLRQAGVALPPSRVLLDQQATRARFEQAWQALLAAAQPGDTLILTYAGHGGQEQDNGPLDELDHKDETLMLHDFNPHHPEQGRINDDELRQLFEQAHNFHLLVVLDACHSGGLVRGGFTRGRSRAGGGLVYAVSLPVFSDSEPVEEDNGALPAHVTLITASHSDALSIDEVVIEGQDHGALSWGMAQALQGAANQNQDHYLDRHELSDYLHHWIPLHTANSQTPALLPQKNEAVFALTRMASPARPPIVAAALPIWVTGGKAPAGLQAIRLTQHGYTLRFEITGKNSQVYNQRGDLLSKLPTQLAAWQQVINKERLQQALSKYYSPQQRPVTITLLEGNQRHRPGQTLHFSLLPPTPQWNALTLFNLAGNGEVQLLYPLVQDPLRLSHFPYSLPELEVGPPYGGDHLVALLCNAPPLALQKRLAQSSHPPSPGAWQQALSGLACQVGQYSFFSGE